MTFSDALVELNKNDLVKTAKVSLLAPIEISKDNTTLKIDIRGVYNLDQSTKGALILQMGGTTNTFEFSASNVSNSKGSTNFSKSIDLKLETPESEQEFSF